MAVNQMLPSLSETSPCGPELGVFKGYSLNSPVVGSSRPSLFAAWPVYQSDPSGASAGSCGRDFGVGTSYSWICTFSTPRLAELASVAVIAKKHSLCRDICPPFSKIVVLRGCFSAWTCPFGEQLEFIPILPQVAIDPGINL